MINALAVEASDDTVLSADLKPLYVEALTLVERLHRRLLDVVKDEFDRGGGTDITSVQALLVFSIGDSEVCKGELRKRGHYFGTNVSHNLKKLVEMGYLHHRRPSSDGRSTRVSLTEKGRTVAHVVDRLYERHVRWIDEENGIAADDFHNMRHSLQRLERFLTDQILYRL